MTIIYTATARDATLIKKVKYRDTTSIAVLNRQEILAQKGNHWYQKKRYLLKVRHLPARL